MLHLSIGTLTFFQRNLQLARICGTLPLEICINRARAWEKEPCLLENRLAPCGNCVKKGRGRPENRSHWQMENIIISGAVSYTHLDVYKRQPFLFGVHLDYNQVLLPRYEIDMNNLKTIYGSLICEKYSYERNVCLLFSNLYGKIKPVKTSVPSQRCV